MIKRLFDSKLWVIILASVAVLTLVLLAMGMSDIHFQPATPIARGESITIHYSVEKIAEEIANIPFWKQVVFWILVFILAIIVASLFSPILRKRIILYILRFGLFVLAVVYILNNYRWLFPSLDFSRVLTPGDAASTGGGSGPSVFNPPQISPTLLYIFSLMFILTLAAVAFLIVRWWLLKQHLHETSPLLEDLAEIARVSRADISSGKNWEDVIIQCYTRMSVVVGEKRELHRRKDLTATEFAIRLEGAGLPGEAIRRLTSLFEAARYGARGASLDEIAEAVACLTTILHACGVNE